MMMAMPTSQGQVSCRNCSAGTLVMKVTTLPMNHGTAVSSSAMNSSTTISARNRPLAWRAKCQ